MGGSTVMFRVGRWTEGSLAPEAFARLSGVSRCRRPGGPPVRCMAIAAASHDMQYAILSSSTASPI
ncbi:hypothetical protein DF035_10035 [Burkholderia contaminans]|nr:hypothetical protein DF035_10035 [Burkholderia contaminans]